MTADSLSLPRYGIHKPYVPLEKVEDHLRLGWMPLCYEYAANPHHRESVHLVFPCRCKLVVPKNA